MTLCPELGPQCPQCGLPDPANNPYCFCKVREDIPVGPSIDEIKELLRRDHQMVVAQRATEKPAEERIVAAAINVGMTISMPPPARHHTILHAFSNWSDWMVQPHEQGFLTDRGRYVSREEAYCIAFRAGQVTKTINPTQLFSEDLW